MEIERDADYRGFWLVYEPSNKDDKDMINWRGKFAKKDGMIFIADSEAKKLYKTIKEYGRPILEE